MEICLEKAKYSKMVCVFSCTIVLEVRILEERGRKLTESLTDSSVLCILDGHIDEQTLCG